jgi:hypothetical protein
VSAPKTASRKKVDRLCARCGHYSNLHDAQGGTCAGKASSFAFDPEHGYTEEEVPWFCGCSGFISARTFGVSTVMDVHDRVWSQLMGLEDGPAPEEGRPYWRPSSLGSCLRRQYLWKAGIPSTRVESEDENADKERKFAWGRDIENHIRQRMFRAGLLIEEGTKLIDEELAVVGHIDFIWGGVVSNELPERAKWWSPPYRWAVLTVREKVAEVLERPVPITGTELKSTSGYAVRKMYDEGPRFDYRCQAGAYWLMAQRNPSQLVVPLDRFEIVVVGRDTVRPLRFEASDVDAQMAEERIGLLNQAWATKQPPNCTCATGEIGYDQQRYCPYPNESGDGCCGSTLLDVLERSVKATKALKGATG